MCVGVHTLQLSLLQPAILAVQQDVGYICTRVLGSYYCLCAWVCVLIWPSGHLKGNGAPAHSAFGQSSVSTVHCVWIWCVVGSFLGSSVSDTHGHVCLCVWLSLGLLVGLSLPGEQDLLITHQRPRLLRITIVNYGTRVCVCVCVLATCKSLYTS